jgi:hypothetical protein
MEMKSIGTNHDLHSGVHRGAYRAEPGPPSSDFKIHFGATQRLNGWVRSIAYKTARYVPVSGACSDSPDPLGNFGCLA